MRREEILEAMLIYLRQLGMPHEMYCVAENYLRAGFTLGTADEPEKYVPQRAIEVWLEAKAEAEKFREQRDLQGGLTEAFAYQQPLGAVRGGGRRGVFWGGA